MMNSPVPDFSGSIPEAYDQYLGPLLFEFSAQDIAKRLAGSGVELKKILEVACGTGISTAHIRRNLPDHIEIIATDLNPAMLAFAEAHRGGLPGVRYEIADATNLPYESGQFDASVCQFGVMFFPDLRAGLSEMYRVLVSGGFAACNIWDSFDGNPAAGIAHNTIAGFFEADPPAFLKVPFGSCSPEATKAEFEGVGFEEVEIHTVEATIERPTVMDVARGFVEGNPTIQEIESRLGEGVDAVVASVAEALGREFGYAPFITPLREFVITAYKPDGT